MEVSLPLGRYFPRLNTYDGRPVSTIRLFLDFSRGDSCPSPRTISSFSSLRERTTRFHVRRFHPRIPLTCNRAQFWIFPPVFSVPPPPHFPPLADSIILNMESGLLHQHFFNLFLFTFLLRSRFPPSVMFVLLADSMSSFLFQSFRNSVNRSPPKSSPKDQLFATSLTFPLTASC